MKEKRKGKRWHRLKIRGEGSGTHPTPWIRKGFMPQLHGCVLSGFEQGVFLGEFIKKPAVTIEEIQEENTNLGGTMVMAPSTQTHSTYQAKGEARHGWDI
ncbi:hypothetical protein ACFX2I_025485 [Malus domestica]